jgi:hypothetical protein
LKALVARVPGAFRHHLAAGLDAEGGHGADRHVLAVDLLNWLVVPVVQSGRSVRLGRRHGLIGAELDQFGALVVREP